jgi:hypothetical protein
MLKQIFEQSEPVRGCLLSKIFVAVVGLSSHARLPGKTHVAKIARGLGACFPARCAHPGWP